MEAFAWRCPYCDRDTTITEQNLHRDGTYLKIDNADGPAYFSMMVVVCPNPNCRRYVLEMARFKATQDPYGRWGYDWENCQQSWRIVPQGHARVWPDYVPQAVVQDYREACAIAELSPKASSTLARRCLQGMIRDFWGIRKDNLFQEINAIADKVDPLTWKAIDAIRQVGNIGAHMEKDIDVIVDVEPHEAEQLIALVELLIRDWYVQRHEREARLRSITEMAASKQSARKS